MSFYDYKLLPLNVRSPLDPRDYRYAGLIPDWDGDVEAAIAAGTLPSEVDGHALGLMPEIWDQGQEGSCTGHGTAGAMMNAYLKAGIAPAERFSPAFVYWQARKIENTLNVDNGAFERDDLQSTIDIGICYESYMPYRAGQFTTAPSDAAVANAAMNRTASYRGLQSWQYIAQALGAENRFVILTSGWYNPWYSPQNGFIRVPVASEQPVGGHCYGFCGYKYLTNPFDGQYKLHFRLHNSWGITYGDGGHVWVDAAGVDSLLWERWTLQAAVELRPKPQPLSHAITATGSVGATATASWSVTHAQPTPVNPLLQGVETEFVNFAKLLKQAGADPRTLISGV